MKWRAISDNYAITVFRGWMPQNLKFVSTDTLGNQLLLVQSNNSTQRITADCYIAVLYVSYCLFYSNANWHHAILMTTKATFWWGTLSTTHQIFIIPIIIEPKIWRRALTCQGRFTQVIIVRFQVPIMEHWLLGILISWSAYSIDKNVHRSRSLVWQTYCPDIYFCEYLFCTSVYGLITVIVC